MALILKPLQIQSINSWKNSNKHAVICLPTGAGKTVIASDIIKNSSYANILVLVNTNHLIKHWEDFIKKYEIDENIIVIKTIQSIYKVTNRKYDLLIGDEAHRLLSPEYSKFLFNNSFKDILFLTCDITRYDGREEILRHLDMKIINEVTHQQAIKQKLLSNFKIINYASSLTEAEEIKYYQYQKFITDNYGKFKYNFHYLMQCLMHPLAQELVKTFNRRKQLLSSSLGKLNILLKILKNEQYTKCIIFCEYIDYAEAIKDFLSINNIQSGVYHSKTSTQAIDDFKIGSSNILISIKALDEGFNIPQADMAVIISPSNQSRRVVQRLGRILRYQEGKEAKLFNIYIKNSKEESWLNSGLKEFKNVMWR